MLGKLFTFIMPIGNVAYRVNLMSAFFGAVTVALLYLLIVQIAIGRMKEMILSAILQPSNFPTRQPPLVGPPWRRHRRFVIGC